MAPLERPVARDPVVGHAAVQGRDDLDPARPVHRRQRPLDRRLVHVGHAHEAAALEHRLPIRPVDEAHPPEHRGRADVVRVAVLEHVDALQADRVLALDAQLEDEPVREVDEILVEDGAPAHDRRLAVVAAVAVGARVVLLVGVLPLGGAAGAEVAVAGRGQRLAQALGAGLVCVVGEHRLLAHRAGLSGNRWISVHGGKGRGLHPSGQRPRPVSAAVRCAPSARRPAPAPASHRGAPAGDRRRGPSAARPGRGPPGRRRRRRGATRAPGRSAGPR